VLIDELGAQGGGPGQQGDEEQEHQRDLDEAAAGSAIIMPWCSSQTTPSVAKETM
jgi:hypothetical protein